MNPGLLIVGGIVAVAFIVAATKPHGASDIQGMEDQPVSIDNIRKGVARGWYQAVLVRRRDGRPAIRLSGYAGNGQPYADIYPISQADFDELQNEGYLIINE